MFDIEACFNQQLLEARKERPTVVFPEPLDFRTIEAICHLTRFVRPVLLANQSKVAAVATQKSNSLDMERVVYAFSECAFVDIAKRQDLVGEYAALLRKRLATLGEPIDEPESMIRASHPAWFAILSVLAGHSDAVVGGAVFDSQSFFRPMIKLLKKRYVATEARILVLPDDKSPHLSPENILVMGDVGLNQSMDALTLAEVAVGICAIARDLFPESVLPSIRGAILTYSQRSSGEDHGGRLVREATELMPEVLSKRIAKNARYSTIAFQEEMKVSEALRERAAPSSQDQASPPQPNVLVCPYLDMGNLLYHLYMALYPSAKKFSSIFGVDFRGVSLAQDCTSEDIRLAVKANTLRIYKQGGWRRTPQDVFFKRFKVLAVNPGSTSTKIAVYDGDAELFTQEIQHGDSELAQFEGRPITDQFHFRRDAIDQFLSANDMSMADLDAVSGRGGLLHPMPHGTFFVNDRMVQDLTAGVLGDHASNLGGLIARDLVEDTGKPAFIVDPVVVDETDDRVKITGIKAIRRKVISHALNQIATAHRYAEDNETFYERLNLIVCHLGGGISIGAHKMGRYIDANDALDGEGPFTPQRSGSLPVGAFLKLTQSGKYTHDELKQLIKGKGGLVDLLGTSDLKSLAVRYEAGDTYVRLILDAQAYQIAKWISSMLPAFDGGRVDQILLTGGMARASFLVAEIRRLLESFGCGITVYPGENELSALAKGAVRVLSGKETAKEYAPDSN